MKDKEDHLLQQTVYQKRNANLLITTSGSEGLEDELLGLLNKLEHRVEVLMAIAHNQQASGSYELAEAYKRQAKGLKKHAESIRKLLMVQTR
jgi:hypothetical protein